VEIDNLETEIHRIRALLADTSPVTIARHKPTLYVVDPRMGSDGLSNFGKTYVELLGDFCQSVGDMLEEEDTPIFIKDRGKDEVGTDAESMGDDL
jgi:hypothetical protein